MKQLLLLCLLGFALGGYINPYLRKPVEPSVNNALEVADYTFVFTIETDLFANDRLIVKVPSQYKSLPLTDTSFGISGQSWDLDLEEWIPLKGSIAAFYHSELKLFEVTVPDMKAGPYSIIIEGITNPTTGGTGSFILETRRNDAYDVDINLLDFNYAFGQVGIIPVPSDFTTLTVASSASTVNALADLTITIKLADLLPGTGSVVLDFSSSILIMPSVLTATTTLDAKATFTTNGKLITIAKLNSDKKAGSSYTVVLKGFTNPAFSGVPGTLKIQTWTNSTNSIINQRKGQNLPIVSAGTITTVSITPFSDLGYAETMSVDDLVTFQLSFTTKNPIAEGGVIKVQWLALGVTSTTCIVSSGLYDISETNAVSCDITANSVLTISGFLYVQANTIVTMVFQATNPAAAGAIAEHLIIETWSDATVTHLIDKYDQPIGITITAVAQISNFAVVVPTTTQKRAAQTASTLQNNHHSLLAWNIGFYHVTAFTAPAQITMRFPSTFSLTTTTCSLTTNAGVSDAAATCAVIGSKLLNINLGILTYSTTLSNSLTLTNIENPAVPGVYPVSVTFLSNAVVIGRKTVYVTILPYALTGITTFRLLSDQSQPTLLRFTFNAPVDLPNGYFKPDFNTRQTLLQLELETANDQFLPDLGTGLTDGPIPCYGKGLLKSIDPRGEIVCIMKVPTAPDPVVLTIKNFDSVLSGSQLVLHLPGIKNPECQEQVTVDVVCPTSTHLTLKIIDVVGRNPTIIYESDSTDVNMILPPVLPQTVTKNPKNDNLAGGVSSNPTPTFSPSTINAASTTNIRYQPSVNKYMTLPNENHMILVFPFLNPTVPQAYMLPINQDIQCNIGLSVQQECYSYKEVGWIVILFLTQDIPSGTSLETTFFITGFTNPFYAATPNGNLQILTVSNSQMVESTIYQPFEPYTPGGVSNVRITALQYEANVIDIEYSWIFSLNDDVPAGGLIDLIFPKNFYNVENSQPPPIYEVYLGLTSLPDGFSQVDNKNVNILTIKNFKPYKADTLISVKVRGVKNPPVAGLTNYFEVQSRTLETYQMDYKRDITPFQILRPLAAGQIQFNYFTMSPDNGSPKGMDFPGNYEMSFYPTRDIPALGYIEITFPSEFDDASFFNDPLRCYVRGAIITFKSCEYKTKRLIKLTLDVAMKVEPGMPPIIISIPNVRNFNADLNSGVLVIRTIYDGVVLDESGTTDTNRKALTGAQATYLTDASKFKLKISPLNEGQLATYNILLIPANPFNSSALIRVEFPIGFPQGLGGLVGCQISELQKAKNDPIQCATDGLSVTLSNQNGYDPDKQKNGFNIQLSSVRNPNAGTFDATKRIRVFILTTTNHAGEYCPDLGEMTFIAAPPILYMPFLKSASPNTRDMANYNMDLTASTAATFDIVQIDYQVGYQIADLWNSKKLINNLESTNSQDASSVLINSIQTNGNFDVKSDEFFKLTLLDIPNPLDPGIPPGYPVVSLYDSKNSQIKMKTYNNLQQFLTPDFEHNGHLIIIADDNPNFYIEAGTYTNDIALSVTVPSKKDITITPSFVNDFKNTLKFTDMIIPSGKLTSSFRIGLDSSVDVLKIIVSFKHNAADYISVRPIYIWIQRNKNVTVTFTDLGQVPAGGRSEVQSVNMLFAPFKPIRFSFYILNNLPTDSSIYPQWLIMEGGVQSGQYWVSTGPASLGVNGSLIMLMDGQDRSIFQIPDRLIPFTVVNPVPIAPFIVSYGFSKVGAQAATFQITASESFTFYFFIGPPCVPPVSYEQIKVKQLPYAFFNYPHMFGEYVDDQLLFNYSIPITGLKSATSYVMYAYVQDFDGNLASQNLTLYFQTPGYSDPLSETITLSTKPTITAQTDTKLVIGNVGSGTVHAIAIRYPRLVYSNLFEAPPQSIRKLTQTVIIVGEESEEAEEDEIVFSVLEQSSFVSPHSSYQCRTTTLNNLTIWCDPYLQTKPSEDLTYVFATTEIIPPSGYQVSRGEDVEGILVTHYAKNEGSSITFDELIPSSDYFIYLAVEENGQFQSNVTFLKGTTHTLYVQWSYLLIPSLVLLLT